MLNLQKGDSLTLNLKKEEITKLQVGLGWDTRMDLDSFAILRDENDLIVDTIYYGHKKTAGCYLNGDNLTGEGEGDDEIIFITAKELNPNVTKISLFANIYSPGYKTFNDVNGAYIRLVNSSNNKELAKYNLSNGQNNFNALHFADLDVSSRDNVVFTIVSKGMNGSISSIKDQLKKGDEPEVKPTKSEAPKKKKRFFGLF